MEKNSQYKCVDYWNERYKDEEHFEWFGDYARFGPILKQKLKPTDRILVLGTLIQIFLILYQLGF